MKYRRYPAYRDSGVEWLGDIPAHWEALPLKYATRIQLSNVDKKTVDEQQMVYLCNYLDVYRNERITASLPFMLASASDEQIDRLSLKQGDVIITKDSESPDDIGVPALVSEDLAGVVCGYRLALIRPVETMIDGRFLFRFFQGSFARARFSVEAVGMTRYGLSKSSITDITIISPPITEQAAIVTFLDRETAQIDTLIAKQERLIAVLQEKRQTLISHVVTKGLNPAVAMKESGVAWLGEVPAHWGVKRLKYLCDIQTGSKDTVDAISDGTYPFFVRSQTIERINTFSFDCEAILTAGDGAGVGKVFHYHKGPFDFHQRVYMLNNFRGVSGLYLFSYLKENFFKVALEGNAKSTVDSLRRPLFLNFVVTVPPQSEQAEIVNFLERESFQIDSLIMKAGDAVVLLKERRSSLISAAVTGKIDVRTLVN